MSRVVLAALSCLVISAAAYPQRPPVRTQELTELMVNSACYPRAAKLPESDQKAFLSKCIEEMTPEVEALKTEMVTVEKSMADTYAQVRSRFVPRKTNPQMSTLLEAQRQWIKFREAHCAFEVEWAMGAYENRYLYTKCALAEAQKREAYLKSLLQ